MTPVKRDVDDVQKLVPKLSEYSVFFKPPTSTGGGLEDDTVMQEKNLISLATRDKAPSDVVCDLLTAEERGKH